MQILEKQMKFLEKFDKRRFWKKKKNSKRKIKGRQDKKRPIIKYSRKTK